MLIVRGVNVFPSAVREVVERRSRRGVSGHILVRPRGAGRQAGAAAARSASSWRRGAQADAALADAIRDRLRERAGRPDAASSSCRGASLERSDYKSKLVEH